MGLGDIFGGGVFEVAEKAGERAQERADVESELLMQPEMEAVDFPEFAEVTTPDFETLRPGLLRQLQSGLTAGRARGRGALAKAGLLGTGAEASLAGTLEAQAGLGRAGIEQKLFAAQLDFETLQQARQNAFNQAQAFFQQGQNEAAAKRLLAYDELTAELMSRRKADQGGFFGNLLPALATGVGTALGGPIAGAVVGGIGKLATGGGDEAGIVGGGGFPQPELPELVSPEEFETKFGR